MRVFANAITIAGWTGVSRILGFVRDLLMATFLGAGSFTDAFVIALRLPNIFRRLFAEGAFAAAFVPGYVRTLENDGLPAANQLAATSAWIMLGIASLVAIACMIFMPQILMLMVPGFDPQTQRFVHTLMLARITMPYLPAMVFVAIMAGTLQSHNRFAVAAALPIVLNVCIVLALILAALDLINMPTMAMAIAVLCAGILQVVVMIIAVLRARIGMRFFQFGITPALKSIFARMIPGILGAGVTQINLVIGDILASFLIAGSISWLYFADRLVQLPLALVGIALSISLLPVLAKAIAKGDDDQSNHDMNEALRIATILAFGAACGLFFLAEPLVRLLFGHGKFSSTDVTQTALALQAFACGLPAFIAIKCLSQGFFARLDTKTPIIIAAIAIAINLIATLILLPYFQHVGIAMGASIAGWASCLAMGCVLVKRGHLRLNGPTIACFLRLPIALLGMVSLILLFRYSSQHFDFHVFLWIAPTIILAMGIYGWLLIALKLLPKNMINLLKRKDEQSGRSNR